MSKTIFKILEKERNNRNFRKSEEVEFFQKYYNLLKDDSYFSKYADRDNFFDVIRANIIIKSIINKNTLDNIIEEEHINSRKNSKEDMLDNIRERSTGLPYIKYNGYKVFITFFNKVTNEIYSHSTDKFGLVPYDTIIRKYGQFVVDPFENYKIDVFDSLFTKFVKIDEDPTAVAFYHYDLNTIFIINRQGSLDNAIYLFDRHIKKANKEHLLERIKPAISAYFNTNLTDFIFNLYNNQLISYHVFRKLCKCKNL